MNKIYIQLLKKKKKKKKKIDLEQILLSQSWEGTNPANNPVLDF